jgi:hypothetical protein
VSYTELVTVDLGEQLADLNGKIILGKVQIINGIILTEQEDDVFIDKIRQQDKIKNELEKTLASESLMIVV